MVSNELIKGCIRNERSAQEQIYKKYYVQMIRLIKYYVKADEEAEEILNNAFLKVFKKINQFNHKSTLGKWISTIVYRSVCDYIKQHKRHDEKIVLIEKDSIVHHETLYHKDLLSIVDELKDSTKKVFNMFVEGYSHREIGITLGISEGTSKWYYSEGRRILKEKIISRNLI